MNKYINKKKLNDTYFIKYKYLFTYLYKNYNFINQNILYNFIILSEKKLCNYNFKYDLFEQLYMNIILHKNNIKLIINIQHYIIKEYYTNKNTKKLIISNVISVVKNIYNTLNNANNIDTILFHNNKNPNPKLLVYPVILDLKYNKSNINKNIYSSFNINIYNQFLKNLKNNEEINNIVIPKYKYDIISCHIGYISLLGLMTSYRMTLEIPNIISTIAMALKNISKDGTLLLFWTIVNINIPIIKKMLSLLSHGFKNIEIIDNDINQNLLIGVPEYYIKCSGYKDNITHELINKLLDIAIESIEYTYDICDVLDYYDDYTEKNPNHSLFYNKKENKDESFYTHLTKKSSTASHSSSHSSSHSLTRKSLDSSTKTKTNTNTKKEITPIYYIEDINIPELDKIMENGKLQFEVAQLMNKLESIFVGYFKMVNNLILNAITKDKNGNLVVKKEAILQKDITNLSKLINMFEYNKLPYNKHALNVVLNKQDEILDHFYSLDTPVNHKLIRYEDRTSKILVKHALDYFYEYNTSTKINTKTYDFSMINDYYNRIKIALQVKNNLISDVSNANQSNQSNPTEHKTPKNAEAEYDYILHDFAGGLCHYLNNKYKTLPIQISGSFVKLWEILTIFNLIPENTESLKVLHLCEAPGEMILCVKYWVESKCPKLNMNNMSNYEWMGNTLNPYEAQNRYRFNKDVSTDMYGLIKHNYDKWLFGNDNTGDITKSHIIKSIRNDIKRMWLGKKEQKEQKLDLIISDGSISFTNNDKLLIQKLDFAQVVSVLACSSLGGNCCIKHFIPYVNLNDPTLMNADTINTSDKYSKILRDSIAEGSGLFVGYLYLYYISFESVSFYKPNSSKSDSSEFYVVCKGFKCVEDEYLDSLLAILDNFTLDNTLIDKNKIPPTFLVQIKNFLESMSNTNILTIEKENLLLTCYKNSEENNKKGQKHNDVLNCDNFFNKKKIEGITIPKYKEWIKIYNFQ